jgi:hypothetical protein
MKRKRVVVLGATGSIGESAAKVARDIRTGCRSSGSQRTQTLPSWRRRPTSCGPEAVCIVDETKLSELRGALDYKPELFCGESGLRDIACLASAEMVLVAVVGTGGCGRRWQRRRPAKISPSPARDPSHGRGKRDGRRRAEWRACACGRIANTMRFFQCLSGKRPTLTSTFNVHSDSSTLDVERWT